MKHLADDSPILTTTESPSINKHQKYWIPTFFLLRLYMTHHIVAFCLRLTDIDHYTLHTHL